ncbi:hypothetical protein EDB85DRAFT_1898006 [Lactarius pseudohatsudake]|nr:hypothetical protein EDB85DRAFT_1898006 [Lactarius pseudohatsudake]
MVLSSLARAQLSVAKAMCPAHFAVPAVASHRGRAWQATTWSSPSRVRGADDGSKKTPVVAPVVVVVMPRARGGGVRPCDRNKVGLALPHVVTFCAQDFGAANDAFLWLHNAENFKLISPESNISCGTMLDFASHLWELGRLSCPFGTVLPMFWGVVRSRVRTRSRTGTRSRAGKTKRRDDAVRGGETRRDDKDERSE